MRLQGHKEVLRFSKVMSHVECEEFAELSGDFNPLHIDATYARRTIAGSSAIHGIFIALYALDETIEKIQPPTSLSAKFKTFVSVGDEVEFRLLHNTEEPGRWKIIASVKSTVAVVVDVASHREYPHHDLQYPEERQQTVIKKPQAIALPKPTDPSEDHSKLYSYDLSEYDLEFCNFSRLSEMFGGASVSALLSMTHFVGMVCPGEDSVFSQFDISLHAPSNQPQEQLFWLSAYDDRVHRYTINTVGPAIRGQVIAFRRPFIVHQEHVSSYRPRVASSDFANLDALVIGGSRGLGAAAAKILALGGAQVRVTYAACHDAARSVVDEIAEHSDRKPQLLWYDIREHSPSQIADAISGANVILYFATPKIRCSNVSAFDKALYDTYFDYYVERLLDLSSYTERECGDQKVFYAPSSIFVETRPSAFAEYTLAKLAMEFICDLQNSKPTHSRFMYTRLPQLKTDQTASLFTLNYGDTFACLYTLLKEIASHLDSNSPLRASCGIRQASAPD